MSPSSTRTDPSLTQPTKSLPRRPRWWIPNISIGPPPPLTPPQPTIPGEPMANASTANPFKTTRPLAQTDAEPTLSLSLYGQETGQKQNGQYLPVPAQFMALVSALGSLSRVALSSARALPVYHRLPPTLLPGDISTLQNSGHFS